MSSSLSLLFLSLLSLSLLSPLSPSLLCPGPAVFSFPSFPASACSSGAGALNCSGLVTAGDGSLNLTAASNRNFSATEELNQVARVLYRFPVKIWPASFCTSFTIRIMPRLTPRFSGDGMAFVVAEDDRASPALSFGSYLGLQDERISGKHFRQLAIEFDTFKNEFDPDDNHIAIDTKSVQDSLVSRSLNDTNIHLKSGKQINVKIKYDGYSKQLEIFVGYVGSPLTSFLKHPIKLSKIVSSSSYIGFTASTGTLAETHQVSNWEFTANQLPYSTVKDNTKKKLVMAVVLPMAVVLFLSAICSYPFIRRERKRKKEMKRRREELERQSATSAPLKFTYKQLVKATRNFSKENLLGSGGFGSVYKGVLSDPPRAIAVKRISATSQQGEKEYLAEICTIGRLRHKNLLQLQGWCHETEHLLLIYDYMPNRSLHHFLGRDFLDWKTRHRILSGLASALLYLHEECGDPIVHRDVKPSNVMLDADFEAHLGDFGLARLLKNTAAVTTMVAGTLGYLAPEVNYTGKATPESDAYSFGVVAMEVICGKRYNNLLGESCLMDYVWDLYAKGALLECMDPRLGENFDKEQAIRVLIVALACLHPASTSRPKMRKVVHVLTNPEEPLMDIPASRPNGVYVSFSGFEAPMRPESSPISSSAMPTWGFSVPSMTSTSTSTSCSIPTESLAR